MFYFFKDAVRNFMIFCKMLHIHNRFAWSTKLVLNYFSDNIYINEIASGSFYLSILLPSVLLARSSKQIMDTS